MGVHDDSMTSHGVCRKLKIGNTGIYKEVVQNFKESYHEGTYKMAFTMLEHIIHENFEYDDMKDYNNPTNILSFIGGRGSGKTSVMMSMAKALEEYDGYRKMPFGVFDKNDNVRFACLDCIDASLLEKGEDIFNLVLAQIFERYIAMESRVDGMSQRSESYDFHKREGLKKIETIYRIVREIEAMNDKKRSSVAASYLSDLDNLSSSQRVKKEFQELVNIFTGILELKNRNSVGYGPKYYLVILIDDIDLNVEYGFAMLEKISRYLMVKNVIVLLTLDYNQMKKLTTEHFYKMYDRSTRNILNDEVRSHVEKISIEYLEKILPVNYRVYMSRVNDIYRANQIEVAGESMGIKRAFLMEIYKRTGICFDSQGKKQHFYYPETLRQTNNFLALLKSSYNVNFLKILEASSAEDMNEKISKLEDNIELLMQDLIYRMAVNKLNQIPEAKKLFDNVVAIDVKRTKELVVSFYYSEILNKETEGFENISYGQLVETLYQLGRCKNNKYKPLVHCLLAYFSYVLTRQYPFIQGRKFSDNDVDDIKKFIGSNVLNKWAVDLLPSFTTIKDSFMNMEDSEEKTYASTDIINSGHKTLTLLRAFNLNFLEADKVEYTKLARMVCDVEVLYCLISNIKNEYYRDQELLVENIDFEIEKIRGDKSILNCMVKMVNKEGEEENSSHSHVDFNILNFIINSLKKTEELKKLEEKLVAAMEKRYGIVYRNLPDFIEAMKRYSLIPKFESWKEKYGNGALPFPLQWFDFSYNVLKRTWKFAKYNFPQLIKKEELDGLYGYIGKVYEYMGKLLDDQGKFYSVFDLQSTFVDCKSNSFCHILLLSISWKKIWMTGVKT